MDTSDVDLEDLEVMLYSQVFYGDTDDSMQNNNQSNHLLNNRIRLDQISESNRYYGKGYGNISQPDKMVNNQIDRMTNNGGNNNNQQHAGLLNDQNTLNSMMLPPLYMHPPVNNIVLIPQPATQIFTSNATSKCYKKLLKLEERYKRKKIKQKEKRRRQKEKKKRESDNFFIHNSVGAHDPIPSNVDEVQILNKPVEVICISDDEVTSNDTSKKANDVYNKNLTNLIKDVGRNNLKNADQSKNVNDTKQSVFNKRKDLQDDDDDNDVIYIPPDPKANEIINLDPDDSLSDKMESEHIQTKQVNNLHQKFVITAKERKEMLSTPESTASNDFLDNPTIGMQHNFNFSLHGHDFVPTSSNVEFLRPKTPADNTDIYETESSCSATDLNTTPVKNAIFNDIDFESPKDLFNDNLEKFGSYIVPKRDLTPNITSLLTPDTLLNQYAKRTSLIVDSQSDSSSESEYDIQISTPKSKVNKLRKDTELPNLSPIQIIDDDDDYDSVHNFCNSPKFNVRNMNASIKEFNKCNKRKGEVNDDLSNKKNKNFNEESENSKNLTNVIALDCSSNSSVESSVFMLSDLKSLDTDLNLANCSSSDIKPSKTKDYKPRKLRDFWTTDIKKYYEQDWDLKNFTMDNVLANMTDDPRKWKIVEADKEYISLFSPKRRRCFICRESGHKPLKCPKKDIPIRCSLCGQKNHAEPRCPNKICTQCGKRNNYSTIYCKSCIHEKSAKCKICSLRGHIKTRCPDLWRRYHNTITETEPEKPQSNLTVPHNKRWCSACASNGHYEFTCNYNRIHPPSDPCVKNYTDVYGFKKSKSPEKKLDNSNNLNFKISVNLPKSNTKKFVEDKTRTDKDKDQNNPTCDDDKTLPTVATATNIVIKLNNTNTEDNQFAYNRQFTIEPTITHLAHGITIQNQNAYPQSPIVYQLPSTSYVPLIDTNVLPSSSTGRECSRQETITISYKHAKYFLEDIPGIDFIHFLESECNVTIKFNLEQKNHGSVTIVGGKKNIRAVQLRFKLYIQKIIPLFLIPTNAKAILVFLRNTFMLDTKCKVYSAYHKLNNLQKHYDLIKGLNNKINVTIKMTEYQYTLNKVYSKSSENEIQNHMITINNIYNNCKRIDYQLPQAIIEQLKESFYFVYYKRRPLNSYQYVFRK